MVEPSLLVVVVLFGGGLVLGLIQFLALLPAAWIDTLNASVKMSSSEKSEYTNSVTRELSRHTRYIDAMEKAMVFNKEALSY